MPDKFKRGESFYFQWHFLESCNLRCLHCYQNSYSTAFLNETELLKIANIMDSAMGKWQRKGRVSLTGGEPFLNPNLLFLLLDYFEKSPNFNWTGILSNGTLLNADIAQTLKNFSKLNEIQISIDGCSKSTHDRIRGDGSFEKAIKAIRLLKEYGFFVAIMFTLHRENMSEVNSVIDLACDLGIDALTIERITPMSVEDMTRFYLSADILKSIYENIYSKKLTAEKTHGLRIRVSRPLWTLVDNKLGGFCPAGHSSLTILHNGTVLPCRRLELPLGNILKDGLFKIWYTSGVLWKLRNKNNLTGKCNNCSFISSCGGCRAIAYTVNNDYMAEDPQCWK